MGIIVNKKINAPKIIQQVSTVVEKTAERIHAAEKIIRETKTPEQILAEAQAKAAEIKRKADADAAKIKSDAEKNLAEKNAALAEKQAKLQQLNADLEKEKAKKERAAQITGLLKLTNSFTKIWTDKGSGASLDVTFYKPNAASGYRLLGDTAYPSYKALDAAYGVMTFNINNKLIKWAHPRDYERVWKDSGSGADWDGAVWKPIPPSADFVAMGMRISRGHSNKPSLTEMVCIEKRFTKAIPVEDKDLVWNDKKSGADRDVSIWYNKQLGTYWSHASHARPSGNVMYIFDLDKIQAELSKI